MLFRSIAIAALASLVAADYAGVVASLATIDKDTAKLNQSVLAFDGNFFLSIPILGDNIQLNQDLDAGTKTAQDSAEFTVDQAVGLIAPVQVLAGDVNITVGNLIKKYPLFKQNNLQGIVLVTLKATNDSSTKYSNAIISKVPVSLQETARSFVTPINAAFEQAIARFSS